MGREERIKLIQDIEKKRGSKVITYVTNDRDGSAVMIAGDIISIIHEHILKIEEKNRKKLDLFIYSRGGNSDVPWSIVSMFREYVGEDGSFNVLIPYRAHSAATVISLGADEIIMTKKAELGPIDATISTGPYNPKDNPTNQKLPIAVEDVKGYFSLMDKIGCERPNEKMNGFNLITNHIHPLALGNISRLLEETKLVAFRLLSVRSNPFSEEENHEIIRKLSSEVYSHNHAISRTEAKKYIGLKQVKNAETENIADEMWNLYLEYRQLFEFENPFHPENELIKENIPQKEWRLNLACVESENQYDICQRTHVTKKIKEIPPNINLSVNAPINIGNLPPDISQEKIIESLKPILDIAINNSTQIAIQKIMNSLPDKGFQHADYDAGWKTEV